MSLTETQWILLRLPKGSKFNRNGVSLTAEQAATDALETEDNKELALASLLRMLAADQVADSETIGEYGYSGPRLLEQAEHWETVGSGSAGTGSLEEVPLKFQRESTDEYSV